MSYKAKISIIGAGNVGATLAHLIAVKELGDVVIVDKTKAVAQGKALDISQSMGIGKSCINITGTNNYQEIQDSNVVIVTAGIARKPGMSRNDLVNTNAQIMIDIAAQIKYYSSNALVIVVTNPLDAMVWVMQKNLSFDHQKVIGMAGVLDSIRFKYFLSQEFGVSINNVNAMVLGGHGDTMIPLVKYSTIAGIPIMELVKMGWSTKERIDQIVQRTRDGGKEIVSLLQKSSAYYAPAAATMTMVESYLKDQKQILACSVYVENYYSIKSEGLYIGMPVVIGKNGVEKIIKLELTEIEQHAFTQSVNAVRELITTVQEL
ncbi:malate dehydrogenase [Orientia tsutsugamushi]|uniref:Malate dehydrogenase n=4 Tax=Orientia tsutsugamushi TaxID=784 RepID=A0A2U3RMG7_ORITS|nr:malate dehydrogenase [Orientia tsutsugamushi]KJV55617.1 malate dehydrogenase, NAD-dependent [Orientia tsutsugamushi str. Kato PP]KJV56942.1 malate dehydrogenase, NAD-dependent [Orientia tsutsugamushi str. Karp]KJV76800.1 malate dehydrogenase, NAD-dependent [Orientia tsutsugamushi str. TA716]KJW07543.1 malate dehydrogenase, NAD-dependent [Orientia tsutsugamushi str. UT144]SPR03910.1 malate dehydrogenase [Orientia tsutsugamushi]